MGRFRNSTISSISFALKMSIEFLSDVQEYIENRGKFMWTRNQLPFPMAETNENLIYNIVESILP